jgi:hypothetical protein
MSSLYSVSAVFSHACSGMAGPGKRLRPELFVEKKGKCTHQGLLCLLLSVLLGRWLLSRFPVCHPEFLFGLDFFELSIELLPGTEPFP